jgi:hypothetical protein
VSYESAPATKMLATHCCVCRRPLVDAKSVELGIGPECRKRHGFDLDLPEAARAEANGLVWEIASNPAGDRVFYCLRRLRELGFVKLVDAVITGMSGLRIDNDGERLTLKAPYKSEAVAALRAVPGRRWDGERKVNTFPISSKLALWSALQSCYHGAVGVSTKGVFQIL